VCLLIGVPAAVTVWVTGRTPTVEPVDDEPEPEAEPESDSATA
jgi:hypothetical protein